MTREFEQLHVCECSQIIAANESTAVGYRARGGGDNRLDDFFPFDPIILKEAAGFINPHYQRWQPATDGEGEARYSNLSNLSGCSRFERSPQSELSDASASVARSLQAMSVTPADELEAMLSRRLAEHGDMVQAVLSKQVVHF